MRASPDSKIEESEAPSPRLLNMGDMTDIKRELYLASNSMIPAESIDWLCGYDKGMFDLSQKMIDAESFTVIP